MVLYRDCFLEWIKDSGPVLANDRAIASLNRQMRKTLKRFFSIERLFLRTNAKTIVIRLDDRQKSVAASNGKLEIRGQGGLD